MNLAEWISDDFAVIDGTETVTYARQGTSRAVDGVKAQSLRREAIEHLDQSLGVESDYRCFSLPAVALGLEPWAGDTVTDGAGTTWRVHGAKQITLGTRWVVMCVKAI